MTLIILNQTANQRSYLSDTVTVPASGSINVSATSIFPLSRDSILIFDCNSGIVTLSDGINMYAASDALAYLNQIATSIGGAVVGLIGNTAPNYSINVGGKDPNGNVAVGSFDATSNLKVIDAINTSSQYQAISVTSSPVEATGGMSRLTNRKFLSITPTNGIIYWATDSSVTTSSGQPVFPNNTLFLSFTDGITVYLVSAGTVDVRVLEAT